METTSCLLCGSTNATDQPHETGLLALPDPYKIVRCRECGFVYMNPRMTAQEYRDFYSSKYYDDYSYDAILSEERHPKFERRVRSLNRLFPSKGRLLDIGTATGEFLNEANKGGWQVDGTEVSSFAAEEGRKNYALNIFVGEVEQAPFAPDTFDVVHLSHVLEHVPDPRQTVRTAGTLLKTGGVLIIEVPHQFGNTFEHIAERFGRRHVAKEPSMHHVSFFTPSSLRETLKREGYRADIRTYSMDTPYRTKPTWQHPLWQLATRCIDRMNGGLYIEAYARKQQPDLRT